VRLIYRLRDWKLYHKQPWWHKEMEASLKQCLKYHRQGNEKGKMIELLNIMYNAIEQMRNF
jgi:hypothetical protein